MASISVQVLVCALCACACIGVTICTDAGTTRVNATNGEKAKNKEHASKPEHKAYEIDPIQSFSTDLQLTLERFLIGKCTNSSGSSTQEQSTAPPRRSLLNNYVSREKDKDSVVTCDRDDDYRDMTGKFAELALSAHYIAKGIKRSEGRKFISAVASVLSTTAKKITESAAFLAKRREAKLMLKTKKLSKSQKKNLLAKQKNALAVKKKNSSRSMEVGEKRKTYATILNGAKLSP